MAAVIVVPGIGGCELYTPPALLLLGGRQRIWLDYLSLLAGGWQLLALQPDGIHPDVPFTGELQEGNPLGEYYGTLIQYLTYQGHYVVGARLDWRQTIARDAARLVSQIRAMERYGTIHLVGHSRGGLVVRQALASLSASGELGRIGRCISLGTPHYGSWAAAGMLAGWESTISQLHAILTGAALATVPALLLRGVLRVVCSWPSPYELLPSPAAPGISQGEIASTYSPLVWQWAGSEVRPAWLAEAQARWSSAPPVPPSVAWCSVVGTGIGTPTRLVRLDALDRPASWEMTAAGDGVVPARWASVPNNPVITSPTGHSAMTYDPRVLDVISRHLRFGISADETLGGPAIDWACLG